MNEVITMLPPPMQFHHLQPAKLLANWAGPTLGNNLSVQKQLVKERFLGLVHSFIQFHWFYCIRTEKSVEDTLLMLPTDHQSNPLSSPPPTINNHHHNRNPHYGTLSIIPDYEIDLLEDIENEPAPFLTPHHKRWSVLEKLNKNYCCRIRSCHDFWKIFSCKCIFSILMLIIFVVLSILLTKAVFSSNNSLMTPNYDFIVVGGGAAGCIITRKLVDAGARVLLLEAGHMTQSTLSPDGGQLNNFDIPLLWSVGQQLASYRWTGNENINLNKGLGGSEVFSSMMYLRALPNDIKEWDLPGWSWERILEAYQSTSYPTQSQDESLFTTSHYQDGLASAFISAAESAGYNTVNDFNDPNSSREGVGYWNFTIQNGVRMSSAKAFLAPLLGNSASLTLQLNAVATNILINTFDANKLFQRKTLIKPIAYGVQYVQNGQIKQATLAYRRGISQKVDFDGKRRIILAAGPIMSPKILLNSGIGDADTLSAGGIDVVAENARIGKDLSGQVMVSLIYPVSMLLASRFSSMYDLPSEWINYFGSVLGVSAFSDSYGEYQLGVLGTPGFSVGAFLTSPFVAEEMSPRPDVQIILHPTVNSFILLEHTAYSNLHL